MNTLYDIDISLFILFFYSFFIYISNIINFLKTLFIYVDYLYNYNYANFNSNRNNILHSS